MKTALRFNTLAATTALLAAGAICTPAFAAENPIDEAGIQHNMYLSCLHDTGTDGDATDALTRVVKLCGFDPGMPLDQFVKTNLPIAETDPTTSLADRMASQRRRFTAYEFSFFERIDDVVRTSRNLDDASRRFAALESEAIAKLDPKSRNGEKILGGLSVARHSLRYWTDYHTKNGGSTQVLERKWWQILITVVADVAGGVAGATTVVATIGAAAAASSAANGLIDVIEGGGD